jgi:hypothetical protein
METPPQTRVELSDLAAAAFLVASGCTFVGLVPSTEPGRQLFVVAGPRDRIEELLAAFDRGDARVEIAPFMGAQRLLKDRLFRHQRVHSPREPLDAA